MWFIIKYIFYKKKTRGVSFMIKDDHVNYRIKDCESRKFGYVRVSSVDQNVDRQLEALKRHHIKTSNIYVDKMSGKDFYRPNYQKMN